MKILLIHPNIYNNIDNILDSFGLVRFYGISAIVYYLMPNPVFTYISNI